ncbi:MAG: hypothetical protein WC444_01275 [Candidatus Paceibacterota bacterium]
MTSTRAIIHIRAASKVVTSINYSRRMYAVIRRYTPDVVEGSANECLADLTGLRTFFKMTYAEIAENIIKELSREIGVKFTLSIATNKAFTDAKNKGKKVQSISTYKEINSLFAGSSFVHKGHRSRIGKVHGRRLAVPFIGKVS